MATRIVGLASGLDVDSIVKALITTEQSKVDKFKSEQTLLQWKNDAYTDVKKLISDFNNKYFSALSSSTNLISGSAFNVKAITTSSNLYANITANSDAVDGSYTINSITSLATGACIESEALSISATTKLQDLNLDNPLVFEDNMLSFSLNGTEFEFKSDESLQSIIKKVNSSDVGVTMSFSSLSGKISIKSKTLGTNTSFDFSDTSGNFLSAFGFAETSSGTDAVLKINNYDVVQKSNNFTIDGVTYNLLKETNESVSFTVNQNIEDTCNRVKNFINDYNTLLDTLTTKLNEEKYRTYSPLTEAQKEDMSEEEIKTWESKAKSGLLKGDSNLRSLISNLRNSFIQTIEGVGLTAYDIGISTSNWFEKGKITLDENKLKSAIANKPDALKELFLKSSSSSDFKTKYNESGIIERFSLTIKNYSTNLTSETLKSLSKKIKDYDEIISNAIEKMNDKEDFYYKKYSLLETTLNKLNSQSNSLSSYFGTNS